MASTTRLRVSLLVRMVVAMAILTSLLAVLAVGMAVTGAILGVFLILLGRYVPHLLLVLPRLTWFVDVPAFVIAPVMAGGSLVSVWLWTKTPGYRNQAYLLPPDGALSWGCFLAGLVTFYLAVAETTFAVITFLTSAVAGNGSIVGIVIGVLLVIVSSVSLARANFREFRERLIDESRSATEHRPELHSMTRKLAFQAGVAEPDVRVVDRDRPESFTIGSGRDAVILVSTGVIDVLETAELQAVLAHEVSHLSNGDSRIMATALIPVLIADDWIDDSPSRPGDFVFNVLLWLLRGYGQFGVAVLSRGREWAADANAATLTGSPAALASALMRLDERRETPTTDLREWEDSMAALDILPVAGLKPYTGLFRTHPDTGDRIERLRRMEARGA